MPPLSVWGGRVGCLWGISVKISNILIQYCCAVNNMTGIPREGHPQNMAVFTHKFTDGWLVQFEMGSLSTT